jgi:hypothetical protein
LGALCAENWSDRVLKRTKEQLPWLDAKHASAAIKRGRDIAGMLNARAVDPPG